MVVLLRTELLKLTTTRAPWLLAAVALAITTALALQGVLGAGRGGSPSIGTAGAVLAVLDSAGRAALVALVIGVLTVAAELRHQTVTSSLLQVPHRTALVAAKAAAAMLAGAGLGLACLIVVLTVGTTSGALQSGLLNADIALRGLGHLATYPLYGLLGAGVGALLGSNQPLAVVLPVAWLAGLEALALSWAPQSALVWSIDGVTAALQNAGTVPLVLPIWLGAGALAAYGLLLVSAGAVHLDRKDIT